MSRSTIHLVRHGEVDNPQAVIYGRLPGYHLSERGRRQAAAAAERLKDAQLGAIWVSPLERAQETAAVIAVPHGLEPVTDERLIESDSQFEGVSRHLLTLLRSPSNWWHLRNPLTPSWGESFADIRARMLQAIHEALAAGGGREVAIVSHQTPVTVARNALVRRRFPPWLTFEPCKTGSVTTIVLDGDAFESASYFSPSDV